MTWEITTLKKRGTYMFDGQFLVTRGVNELLSPETVLEIHRRVRKAVEENNGIDYLVVIKMDSGEKLFFIDQLNRAMKKDHPPEHNYCTLMLSSEY